MHGEKLGQKTYAETSGRKEFKELQRLSITNVEKSGL